MNEAAKDAQIDVRTRLRADVFTDPEYARRVLECHDLGLDADASDAAIAAARKAAHRRKIRQHFRLPEDATDDQVASAREREVWANIRSEMG